VELCGHTHLDGTVLPSMKIVLAEHDLTWADAFTREAERIRPASARSSLRSNFRDYLREHPDTARAYATLKQRLADECHGDIHDARLICSSQLTGLLLD
jgi:GrpB-like predicted nucleotidyltransferase (UPF0157 family)